MYKVILLTSLTSWAAAAVCPPDYIPHPTNGHCYIYVATQVIARKAERDCRSRGTAGKLVQFTDATLVDWVYNNVLTDEARRYTSVKP